MPIKSRSALAFFARVHRLTYPRRVPPCLSCFVTLTISRSSNLRRRDHAYGACSRRKRRGAFRSDFRVFRCTTDNLFVARNGQEQKRRRNSPFAPFLVERTSLRCPSSCGDLTRPRDESALRRECAPSPLAPSHRGHFVSLPSFYPTADRSDRCRSPAICARGRRILSALFNIRATLRNFCIDWITSRLSASSRIFFAARTTKCLIQLDKFAKSVDIFSLSLLLFFFVDNKILKPLNR